MTYFICGRCDEMHDSAAIPAPCAVAVLDMDDLAGHTELIREDARRHDAADLRGENAALRAQIEWLRKIEAAARAYLDYCADPTQNVPFGGEVRRSILRAALDAPDESGGR